MSCADRPCFSSSDVCLFCWAAFFPSAYWRMPKMSRAFVHGHTFLHSWSGPMKLVVCLLHGATLLSNLSGQLLSLLRALDTKITRSLPSPSLCQPRTLSEPQASYRSTIPLQVQNHGTSLALGFYSYLDPALASNPTLSRGVSATLSSTSLSARAAGGHSHERKKTVAWCRYILKILSN